MFHPINRFARCAMSALALLMLTAGQLTSERPKIPVEQLAEPGEMSGIYHHDFIFGGYYFVRMKKDDGREYRVTVFEISSDESDNSSFGELTLPPLRFIETAFPGIYVAFGDIEGEKNRTGYALWTRTADGTGYFFGLGDSRREPWDTDSTAQYPELIARKYGFQLDRGEAALKLAGRPRTAAILALFRDPAFVWAIVEPDGITVKRAVPTFPWPDADSDDALEHAVVGKRRSS